MGQSIWVTIDKKLTSYGILVHSSILLKQMLAVLAIQANIMTHRLVLHLVTLVNPIRSHTWMELLFKELLLQMLFVWLMMQLPVLTSIGYRSQTVSYREITKVFLAWEKTIHTESTYTLDNFTKME